MSAARVQMVKQLAEMTMTTKRLMWMFLIGILSAPATARAQDEVVYYHTDAIGSVRMISDEAGTIIARYDYTPFGQPWNPPSTAELLQFTGKERDLQTELDYMIARDFMSLTGRFTTPDDPAYIDPFNPQSMNRFAYAHNNPFRYNDPTGHSADCVGGFDAEKRECREVPGFPGFSLNGLVQSLGTAVEIAQPVTNWFTAPRDPSCMAGSAWLGASVGAVAGGMIGAAGGGAGAAVGGTLVAPGVGTIGLGLAGGGAGFLKGSVFGSAAGSAAGGTIGFVACMGTGGSGGGGGGSNQHENRAFREAVRQIEKALGANRKLRRDQIEQLHREISKQNFTLQEIVELGIAMFR
jgi:RHS repeat-associated protein